MKVAIIGLGWLGLPLACELKNQGVAVVGTKTSVNQTKIKGVPVHSFNIYNEQEYDLLWHKLKATTVVFNIPPLRGDLVLYESLMKKLIDSSFKGGIEQVLFISSTSVYGGAGQVSEGNDSLPATKSGVVHRNLEHYLSSQYPGQATILRLSGLVGGDRHPVHSLAGRVGIKAGLNAVNLIHRIDVITAIKRIFALEKWGRVFHLCADAYPTRHEYYTWAAKKLLLPEPQFELEESSSNKWVDATQTNEELGLKLEFPSPYDMPLIRK